MARKTIQISSIFEGFSPSENFGGQNQYLAAIGIDCDMPISDDSGEVKTSGFIRPVKYAAFSSTEITSSPIAILTNPKDENTYVVLSDGSLISYDVNLSNGTLIGQVQESSSNVEARGAWYYNNYIYIATPHDVARYGPLDGSPSLTSEVWTGATLGSQDPTGDADFPVTLFDVGYLNHFGFSHSDGASYFLDFQDGRGFIHKIQTMKGSAQGDTDDGSAFQSVGDLSLPHDYLPMTACSMGVDIVIAGAKTSSSTVSQGNAILGFWNAADELFDRFVTLPDPICSALTYVNGVLYGLSGSLTGGYRLWRYVGGDAIETLKIIEDGYPPLQYAIAFAGNRIVWCANTTTPYITSGLYAYGSKSGLFTDGLHHIALSGFTTET